MVRSLWLVLSLGLVSLSLACGEDEASPAPTTKLSKAGSGGGGEGGSEAAGSSAGGSETGGSETGGTDAGGSSSGGSTSGGQGGSDGPACVTSPPELLDCGSASGCQACLCDKCADAWAECMADDGCKKAVACVAAGCSLSQCASLTSGEASLARAEAIEDCRASKQKCRTECTGGGVGGSGSGGSDVGGSGGSDPGGNGGSSAGGSGGSGTVTEPTCCSISDKPGCNGASSGLSAEEQSVQTCVCAKDSFCCENSWDETCIGEISEFGCGPACPAGGQGGSGGNGGSGNGGSGNNGGSGGSAAGGAGGGGQECVPGCGFGKVCDPNTGNCEECLTNAECKESIYGPTCLGTSGQTSLICGCSSNFDCKTHPGGLFCEPFTNVCGCKSAQDCADSPQGKACVQLNDPDKGKINQCGCSTEADCAPGEKCLFNLCAQP